METLLTLLDGVDDVSFLNDYDGVASREMNMIQQIEEMGCKIQVLENAVEDAIVKAYHPVHPSYLFGPPHQLGYLLAGVKATIIRHVERRFI